VIFVDTGPLLARHIARDQYHGQATTAWGRLERRNEAWCTSNFVLDELFTLLGRRTGYPFAAERARHLYASRRVTILRPAEEEEREALDLFEKYADQAVSFTDCTSFALMRSHRIRRCFTFDRHFVLAGFTRWPPR